MWSSEPSDGGEPEERLLSEVWGPDGDQPEGEGGVPGRGRRRSAPNTSEFGREDRKRMSRQRGQQPHPVEKVTSMIHKEEGPGFVEGARGD